MDFRKIYVDFLMFLTKSRCHRGSREAVATWQDQLVDVLSLKASEGAFAAITRQGLVAWGHQCYGGDCSKWQAWSVFSAIFIDFPW